MIKIDMKKISKLELAAIAIMSTQDDTMEWKFCSLNRSGGYAVTDNLDYDNQKIQYIAGAMHRKIQHIVDALIDWRNRMPELPLPLDWLFQATLDNPEEFKLNAYNWKHIWGMVNRREAIRKSGKNAITITINGNYVKIFNNTAYDPRAVFEAITDLPSLTIHKTYKDWKLFFKSREECSYPKLIGVLNHLEKELSNESINS